MQLKQFKREVNKLTFKNLKKISQRWQAQFDPYGESYEYTSKNEIVYDMTEHYRLTDLPRERAYLIREVKAGN